MWFTELTGNKIGRITTAGAVTEYPLPAASSPGAIGAGPDGALWFLGTNQIGRITTAGTISAISATVESGSLNGIITGADGNLWFTNRLGNNIGRLTPR